MLAEIRQWKPFLHFCQDWDFLVIDENDAEFEACGCFPGKRKPQRHQPEPPELTDDDWPIGV